MPTPPGFGEYAPMWKIETNSQIEKSIETQIHVIFIYVKFERVLVVSKSLKDIKMRYSSKKQLTRTSRNSVSWINRFSSYCGISKIWKSILKHGELIEVRP